MADTLVIRGGTVVDGTGSACYEADVAVVGNKIAAIGRGLPKGDRGELAVELMTEIGVDAVTPWAAERSITRWHGDRGVRALAKWRSTAWEAAKQSRRAWWPEVTETVSTARAAKLLEQAKRKERPRDFRRYGSARKLYNFNVDHADAY